MKITKYPQGWKIEPSTDKEEEALEFFLKALQEKYGKSIVFTDALSATDKHHQGQVHASSVSNP